MADEILKIDANSKNVAGAVTDDSNLFIKMLRIDDTTKGLKVNVVGGIPIVAGTDQEVQYNKNGALGADANFKFDYTNQVLKIGDGVPTYTISSNNILSVTKTVNTFLATNLQNLSNGGFASTDLTFFNDQGTDTSNYLDIGIAGSGNTDPAYTFAGAGESYMYAQSSNISFATNTAGKAIRFFTGGTLAANKSAEISDGKISIGLVNTTLGKLQLFGNTSGNVTLQPNAVAGTNIVLTLPATTGTVALIGDLANYVPYTGATGDVTLGANNLSAAKTLVGAGAVGTPAVTFLADADNGMYYIGTNNYGFAAAGAKVLDISSSGLGITGSITSVGDITGGASSMTITAGTGNSRTLTLKSTTAGGTATAFLTGNADQTTTFGAGISGTGAWSITGGAGNMTIVSGTGASRTMIFQTTTAGSTPTTALTLNADQSATFAGAISNGTSGVLTTGTIELGAASDTTIARVSAGVISVEGVTIPSVSSTNTITNKRNTKRLVSVNAPGGTPTTNTDNCDIAEFTGLNAAITSMTTNLSGTPVNGDFLEFIFLDDGTARGITWGTSFSSSTVTLPTTTVISTALRVLVQWQTIGSLNKWVCVATA